MLKLSVVVPVYNAERYIEQCIETVLKQTFRDFELILVNDGSTDKSGELCDKWSEKDERIIVVHKENGGQLSARSCGVNISKGEYLAFIDSDDFIGSNLFGNLFSIIDKYHPEILAYGYTRVSVEGQYIDTILNGCKQGLYNGERINEIIKSLVSDTRRKNYNMGSIIYGVASKIFQKDFYQKIDFSNISKRIVNGEDMAVTMKCIANCQTLYVSDVADYFYRQRKNSMLHSFRSEDLSNYFKLYKFLMNDVRCVPQENLKKFMCEVISHNVYLAAKEMITFNLFRDYYKANIDNFVLELLSYASIKTVGFRNWIRVYIIRNRLWVFLMLYRVVQKRNNE